MKKKIIKIIGMIVAIAIILFLAITIRKASMIRQYSKKLEEYQNVKNFYAKFEIDNFVQEMWRKEDIGITKVIKEGVTRTMCINSDEIRLYMEDGESKKVSITKMKNENGAFLPVIEMGTVYA